MKLATALSVAWSPCYGTALPDEDKRALIEFLKTRRQDDIKKEPLRTTS